MSGRDPVCTITSTCLRHAMAIAVQLEALSPAAGTRPGAAFLRWCRESRLRTVQASLALSGCLLDLRQAQALADGDEVFARPHDARAARNLWEALSRLDSWTPQRREDLFTAHDLLLRDLAVPTDSPRVRAGGNPRGRQAAGPSLADMVQAAGGLDALLDWLGRTDAHPLVAACIVHCEILLHRPFADGNGRLARLWQSLVLGRWHPLLGLLPVDARLLARRDAAAASLSLARERRDDAPFAEFMLGVVLDALVEAVPALRPEQGGMAQAKPVPMTQEMTQEYMSHNDASDTEISSSGPERSPAAGRPPAGDMGLATSTACAGAAASGSPLPSGKAGVAGGTARPLQPQMRRLLRALVPGSLGAADLMRAAGFRSLKNFRTSWLDPALAEGLVERTQPLSPRSPTQRYILTPLGRERLSRARRR